MAVQDYKINYKSDFVLNINGDAGWAVPFCIKFWTGMPSQAYFVGFDGVKYVNCRVGDTPTQLLVMFDDHHLPIGPLRMQIAYHTTIEEFPGSVFDEVTNARDVIVTIDGTDYQVMLDFTGEDAPELEFDLPAYANEAERIQNELQRQQNEADRIAAELQREQDTAAAVQGAENVNAQLNGTTLTVTNRQGVSTSVNTKGEQGEQGPVGPEGPQGQKGVSVTGLVKTGETDTDTLYNVTFSDGTTQAVAIPKGAKGDTGATGPTGPQGPQGQTGVSITGLVKTGETETDTLYNVTFSNGTTQAVSIPKGEKGDQGEQGPQGPQGPMGDVAVITPEQQAAFTMYRTTGQNTNGPMTQKAVTDALGNIAASGVSYDNSESGLTAENVQGALDESAYDIMGVIGNKIAYGDSIWNYDEKFINTDGSYGTSSSWTTSKPILLKKGWAVDINTQGSLFCAIAQINGSTITPLVNSGSVTGVNNYWYINTSSNDIYVVLSARIGSSGVAANLSIPSEIERVVGGSREITVSDTYSYKGFSIGETTYAASNKYEIRVLNVVGVKGFLTITSNSAGSTVMAFMKTLNTPTNGGSIGVFADGYSARYIQNYNFTAKYEIPSDCNYIIFTKKLSNDIYFPASIKLTSGADGNVDKLSDEQMFNPILTYNKWEGYLMNDDTYGATSNYRSYTTNKLPCSEGDKFLYKGWGSYSAVSLIMYNDSIIVDSDIIDARDEYALVIIPSGVNYIKFSSFNRIADTPILEVYKIKDIGISLLNRADTPLSFAKINWLGDSYVANHQQLVEYTWHYKIAKKYSMTYRNYGINGNGIVAGSNPMVSRYTQMDADADYVCVVGGTNDFNYQLAIADFKAGVRTLIEGLVNMYPKARIAFFTSWNEHGQAEPTQTSVGLKIGDYANAIADVCYEYGVPCFNSFKDSGIFAWDAGFRTQFFQSSSDMSHLNEEGHIRFMSRAEPFLLSL